MRVVTSIPNQRMNNFGWLVRFSNVVPPVATGEPEADPGGDSECGGFLDWKDIKKHLADPDSEVFDKTPDEEESEPPRHRTVEQETGSQTPATSSAAPEATVTAVHDGQ